MSVELTAATTSFMGDAYTFLDCPGSVEFVHDMRAVLPAIDAAVVVCELDEKKIPQLQLILRELEDRKIPRVLFVNKIDKADAGVHDVLKLLQPASRTKLILRQIPTFAGDIITGFVDLALERAFVYKEHAPSEVIPLEGDAADLEKTARFSMLEMLADHDDELMEQLLEDIQPPRDKVFDDLTRELRDGLVCPVLMGTATRANGVLRLLKALRHESPGIAETAKRVGVKTGSDAVAYVLKTLNTTHGGKMSVVRMLAGQAGDGTTFVTGDDEAGRVAGVFKLVGQSNEKRGPATVGETVAFAELEKAKTGDTLSAGKQAHPALRQVAPYPPVLAIAISAKERKDDVKLGQALHKLAEEDPSITIVHNPETHEVVLWGQGEMHLRVATERLSDRYGVAIERRDAERRLPRDHPKGRRAARPAQETIRRPRPIRRRRARYQTAAARRADFPSRTKSPAASCRAITFRRSKKASSTRSSTGRSAFRWSICMWRSIDGSYHTVDSSDMAFRTAGRIGIVEGLPQCQPVLLEPIHLVEIVCPNEATAKINALMSGRRGQILGFDTREGWDGWDIVRAKMPEAEIGDLIVEIRSATAGAGTFTFKFDHMAELTGRTADQIIAARRAAE